MAYKGKYLKPSARKVQNPAALIVRTAMVLLCLVMVSTCLMGGLLAKYSATGQGDDEARVAKFEVHVKGVTTENIYCTAEKYSDGVYTIAVKNSSEVAVRYTLAVTMSGDAADGVTASFDADAGTLAPNTSSSDHTLTFSVVDWSKITDVVKNQSGGEFKLDFSVTVVIEQID